MCYARGKLDCKGRRPPEGGTPNLIPYRSSAHCTTRMSVVLKRPRPCTARGAVSSGPEVLALPSMATAPKTTPAPNMALVARARTGLMLSNSVFITISVRTISTFPQDIIPYRGKKFRGFSANGFPPPNPSTESDDPHPWVFKSCVILACYRRRNSSQAKVLALPNPRSYRYPIRSEGNTP